MVQQSQEQNPETWKALQTYVGFSTIPNLTYTNSGSFITDFFIDASLCLGDWAAFEFESA